MTTETPGDNPRLDEQASSASARDKATAVDNLDQALLDQALYDSFPASDPLAFTPRQAAHSTKKMPVPARPPAGRHN